MISLCEWSVFITKSFSTTYSTEYTVTRPVADAAQFFELSNTEWQIVDFSLNFHGSEYFIREHPC
jgi:hypothetical protein